MPALELLNVKVMADGLAGLVVDRPGLKATVHTLPRTPAAARLVKDGRVRVMKARER